MNGPAETHAIPQAAAQRLVRNVESFLNTVRDARAAADPGGTETARWLRVEQTLQKQFAAVEAACKAHEGGDASSLVQHAADLKMLARRMDGYDLGFAGPAFEEQLTNQRRLLVLVAWQIDAVSRGSGSAGL